MGNNGLRGRGRDHSLCGRCDYAIVHGRRDDGVIVLTILEKTDGHLLYRFEGTLSPKGLEGSLTASGGNAIAGGVVFATDPDADARL